MTYKISVELKSYGRPFPSLYFLLDENGTHVEVGDIRQACRFIQDAGRFLFGNPVDGEISIDPNAITGFAVTSILKFFLFKTAEAA